MAPHCLRRESRLLSVNDKVLESWSLPPPPASSCSFLFPLPQHPPSASPVPRMHPALGLCMCWSPSRANASILHPALAPSGRAYDHPHTTLLGPKAFASSSHSFNQYLLSTTFSEAQGIQLKKTQVHVHSSTVHSSQKWETTQMSINR